MTDWSKVSADGQTFVFADEGEGPLVMLIHGFPDTPHGWERISAALVDAGYRAVRPWLRGYHPETIVEGRAYDMATIASDPIALLDALGEPEAVIVGHDWGGWIAFGAASFHSDRVPAVAAIGIPHQAVLPRDLPTLWDARHFVGLNVPWAEWKVRRAGFAYLEKLYRRWAPAWHGPDRERCLVEARAAFADPRVVKAAVDYYRALSPRTPPELKRRASVPGLVVAGTSDLAADVYERSAAMLGQGSETLILDGAGHWPHREREDAFIARLLEFLRTV